MPLPSQARVEFPQGTRLLHRIANPAVELASELSTLGDDLLDSRDGSGQPRRALPACHAGSRRAVRQTRSHDLHRGENLVLKLGLTGSFANARCGSRGASGSRGRPVLHSLRCRTLFGRKDARPWFHDWALWLIRDAMCAVWSRRWSTRAPVMRIAPAKRCQGTRRRRHSCRSPPSPLWL